MNIKKQYEKLYGHWLEEFHHAELTQLDSSLFKNYVKLIAKIENLSPNSQDSLQQELLHSYKQNFHFLLEDLLKIRKRKIIDNALTLKEIDTSFLSEAEKLLYQKLISALKGFEKVQKFSMMDKRDKGQSTQDLEAVVEDLAKVEEMQQEMPSTKESLKPVQPTQTSVEPSELEYILIRFINPAPPLVGVDFVEYGPFQKEDIAFMPQKNAKILIYEKFAKKIYIP